MRFQRLAVTRPLRPSTITVLTITNRPALRVPAVALSAKETPCSLASSSYSYPLLGAFWTIFMIFLWFIWFWILITIIIDLFRSHDLSGWAKALWFIFILLLPLIGVLVYLIARGGKMHEHAVQQVQHQDAELRSYVQEAAVGRLRRTSWPSSPTCVTVASSRPRSSTARKPRSWPERNGTGLG